MDDIGTVILAAGVLGTAAFGIVEALKWWPYIGEIGFGKILEMLGPVKLALAVAYGQKYEKLLRAQYRGDSSELARTIRQGVRVGLTVENAAQMARFLGVVEADSLRQAAHLVQTGDQFEDATLRNVLGKFELAVDTRIDAALTLAQNQYAAGMKVLASIVALIIALFVYFTAPGQVSLLQAILVGLIAVPIAPVAKDLVTALQSASQALRLRK